MYGCVITQRSLTLALKGESLLKASGIACRVVKPDSGEGCKYGLLVQCSLVDRALDVLKAAGIQSGKILA